MQFDGMQFRKRNDLGFRYALPGEKYPGSNEEIGTGYVVFYKIEDAHPYERDGTMFFRPDTVTTEKLIPTKFHGLTNMAYGPEKKRGEYLYSTVYLGYDGRVYTCTRRRAVSS